MGTPRIVIRWSHSSADWIPALIGQIGGSLRSGLRLWDRQAPVFNMSDLQFDRLVLPTSIGHAWLER